MARTHGRLAVLCASLTAALLAGCSGVLGPLDELPRELTVAERRLVSSGNDFGLSLFARLAEAQREENLVLSPLSAFMALGMVTNGASGETLTAMRATLGQSDLSEQDANEAYRGLIDLLLGLDQGVEFRLANSIWYRRGFPVKPAFVDLSRGFFDAEVSDLDFADPGAPGVINAWVENETNGRIRELIEQIDSDQVMFLINAVYFKGDWQRAFDRSKTETSDFRRLDGSVVQVPMMEREELEGVRYQFREEFEAAELLYGRGAFVMTILLPPEGVAPADLVADLDADRWNGWMDGFSETSAAVLLPRFRLDWEKLLNDELKAMGMELAFDPDRADFDRLVEEGAVLPGNLYITEVKQKAFVEVNEEGTEAAAATSVGVGVTSAPPTLRVDRPFLFAIRERFSGTVLFIGQVLDPTAT